MIRRVDYEKIGSKGMLQVSAEATIEVWPSDEYGLQAHLKGPTEDLELDCLIRLRIYPLEGD